MSLNLGRRELTFGKHRGETLEEVAESDILYLDWLIGQTWFEDKDPTLFKRATDLCEERSDEIEKAMRKRNRQFAREADFDFDTDDDWDCPWLED